MRKSVRAAARRAFNGDPEVRRLLASYAKQHPVGTNTGSFNAKHPRYPKGHPLGGKFAPKGSAKALGPTARHWAAIDMRHAVVPGLDISAKRHPTPSRVVFGSKPRRK